MAFKVNREDFFWALRDPATAGDDDAMRTLASNLDARDEHGLDGVISIGDDAARQVAAAFDSASFTSSFPDLKARAIAWLAAAKGEDERRGSERLGAMSGRIPALKEALAARYQRAQGILEIDASVIKMAPPNQRTHRLALAAMARWRPEGKAYTSAEATYGIHGRHVLMAARLLDQHAEEFARWEREGHRPTEAELVKAEGAFRFIAERIEDSDAIWSNFLERMDAAKAALGKGDGEDMERTLASLSEKPSALDPDLYLPEDGALPAGHLLAIRSHLADRSDLLADRDYSVPTRLAADHDEGDEALERKRQTVTITLEPPAPKPAAGPQGGNSTGTAQSSQMPSTVDATGNGPSVPTQGPEKARPPSVGPSPMTEAEENAIFDKGRAALAAWSETGHLPADFDLGAFLITGEAILARGGISREEHDQAQGNWAGLMPGYRAIAAEAGAGFEERVNRLRKRLLQDGISGYMRGSARITDWLASGKDGNCELGSVAFTSAFISGAGADIPPPWKFLFQAYRDHYQPVLYNTATGEVYDLIDRGYQRVPEDDLYDPAVLVQGAYSAAGVDSGHRPEDFLYLRARPSNAAVAAAPYEPKGTNSLLVLPSGQTYAGTAPPPETASRDPRPISLAWTDEAYRVWTPEVSEEMLRSTQGNTYDYLSHFTMNNFVAGLIEAYPKIVRARQGAAAGKSYPGPNGGRIPLDIARLLVAAYRRTRDDPLVLEGTLDEIVGRDGEQILARLKDLDAQLVRDGVQFPPGTPSAPERRPDELVMHPIR